MTRVATHLMSACRDGVPVLTVKVAAVATCAFVKASTTRNAGRAALTYRTSQDGIAKLKNAAHSLCALESPDSVASLSG